MGSGPERGRLCAGALGRRRNKLRLSPAAGFASGYRLALPAAIYGVELSSTLTVLALPFAVSTSGLPSPFTSATASASGASPVA
jgi:hypothetical protein